MGRCRDSLAIAFLVGRFPARSETFISRKVDFLLAQGHDVHVFCKQCDGGVGHAAAWRRRIHAMRDERVAALELVGAGARYARALASRRIRAKQLQQAVSEAKEAAVGRRESAVAISHLINRRWDLVHAHFLCNLDRFAGLRSLVRCPIIGAVYGYDVTICPHQDGGLRRLETQVAQVNGLTYSSAFLRNALHALVDVSAEEMILHPEVPTELFRARTRAAPHSPLRLLSVGRLHWTKGFGYALSAVRLLLDDGLSCEYRIVGEGEARTELEYTMRQLELTQDVRLQGAVPPEGVRDAMDWADLLLLPSVREDFGNVLVEAQASGLPIVASKVGGTPEATKEAVTALLVPPRHPDALGAAVKALVSDKQRYRSFSEQGPEYAQKFRADRIGAQLLSFYESVLSRARTRG